MSRRFLKSKKIRKSKQLKKYKKTYKGGEGKCAEQKPICIKINKYRQKISCSKYADGKTQSNPAEELLHAYEVEINRQSEESRDDNVCVDSDRSNCFCTNFDFVWLTNIGEAKKMINNRLNEIRTMTPEGLVEIEKNAETTKMPDTKIEPFDYIGFINTYIDIAKQKWGYDETQNGNTSEVIKALEETVQIIEDSENKEIPINGSIEEFVLNAMKKVLPVMNDMFEIGKAVILTKDQIDNNAKNAILEKIENIKSIFRGDNVSGGKKRKTLYKKKKRQGTKKKYRQYGGSMKIRLGGFLYFLGGIVLAPFTFGISFFTISIMGLGDMITGKD
jgi:hypothetical protein